MTTCRSHSQALSPQQSRSAASCAADAGQQCCMRTSFLGLPHSSGWRRQSGSAAVQQKHDMARSLQRRLLSRQRHQQISRGLFASHIGGCRPAAVCRLIFISVWMNCWKLPRTRKRPDNAGGSAPHRRGTAAVGEPDVNHTSVLDPAQCPGWTVVPQDRVSSTWPLSVALEGSSSSPALRQSSVPQYSSQS